MFGLLNLIRRCAFPSQHPTRTYDSVGVIGTSNFFITQTFSHRLILQEGGDLFGLGTLEKRAVIVAQSLNLYFSTIELLRQKEHRLPLKHLALSVGGQLKVKADLDDLIIGLLQG